jgi:hypothetical protein
MFVYPPICRLGAEDELLQLHLTLFALRALETLPDLANVTSLQELRFSFLDKLTALPRGIRGLAVLKRLTLYYLKALEEVPDLARLTALQELTISRCPKLVALPDLARLTALTKLDIESCHLLTWLPRGIGALALRQLRLHELPEVEVLPDLARLTALQELRISYCDKLTALHEGIGALEALKNLRLQELRALEVLPDLARLTALTALDIACCLQLRRMGVPASGHRLPRGIGALGALKQLRLYGFRGLEEMPDLTKLTALQTLRILRCSGLSMLSERILELSALKELHIFAEADEAAGAELEAEMMRDVLAIGRALKAWPLPFLVILEVRFGSFKWAEIRLSRCWRALGLPTEAAAWSNSETLDFLRVQQHKVAVFASGLHGRLGAGSQVSGMDEQVLVLIADEVLGGWSLRREWGCAAQAE